MKNLKGENPNAAALSVIFTRVHVYAELLDLRIYYEYKLFTNYYEPEYL